MVEVAIVRPGPIQGGMVHPYLRPRAEAGGPGAGIARAGPALARTLGVPIFQEQVMQIAMIAAGFTPARPMRCAAPWPPGSARAACQFESA